MADDEQIPEDARAIQLLPPPRPPDPPFKKVAERRICGWGTIIRLSKRIARRPAGNSRRFWRKVEADDPFLPGPPEGRSLDESHSLYPVDRADREVRNPRGEQSALGPLKQPKPKAQPQAAKPEPSQARQQAQPPAPAVHTPDPRRPAPAPQPAVRPQPKRAAPPPEPEPEPVVQQERRLPPKMPPPARPQPGSWSARNAAAQNAPPVPGEAPKRPVNPTSEKTPPAGMNIDRAMNILAELREAEAAMKRGEKSIESPPLPRSVAQPQRPAPAPPPRQAAPPPPRQAAPQPQRPSAPPGRSAAGPSPPPGRSAPPSAPPARPSPPPGRSALPMEDDDEDDVPMRAYAPAAAPQPGRVAGSGKLDDIFGGPTEGRVKLGAPKKKTLE